MREIKKPIIKLSEFLSKFEYEQITKLQNLCKDYDKTELKLELEYKYERAEGKTGCLKNVNEFMYYDGELLIGYLGICYFGGESLEVNGMVHPEYRRVGVFAKLFQLVMDEFNKREVQRMLVLTEANSVTGQGFIKSINAVHEHSEYEMYLRESCNKSEFAGEVKLRKATNQDVKEITKQNSVYFGVDLDESATVLPEEEEKCGMDIYIAEADGDVIGKVNLLVSHLNQNRIGGIFGLGVMPEFRSKGYGREILRLGIGKLKEKKVAEIMLQVAAKNNRALELYKSCGFVVTSTMDYYLIKK